MALLAKTIFHMNDLRVDTNKHNSLVGMSKHQNINMTNETITVDKKSLENFDQLDTVLFL